MSNRYERGVSSVVLTPAAAATTVRTANIDCQDADYALVFVNLGVELNTASTNVAITLSESDETASNSFSTFNASFNRTVDNTAAVVATYQIDLRGLKRYLRLTVTPDATTNGPVVTAANALLYKTVVAESPADDAVSG